MTLRWPISSRPDGPTIGPPQFLQWYQTRDGFSCSRDGRVVAMAIYDGGGLVFDADQPDRSRRILPHRDTRGIALSPDGRWFVTSPIQRRNAQSLGCPHRSHGPRFSRAPAPRARRLCSAPTADGWPSQRQDQGWELIETETWTIQNSARELRRPGGVFPRFREFSPTRPISRAMRGRSHSSSWRPAASWHGSTIPMARRPPRSCSAPTGRN